MSQEEALNKIATLTGGRAAEEVIFHSITTGASNDIEQATKLARAMVTRYGMSSHLGMVALETVTNQYLGGDSSLACSPETAKEIDDEVVELSLIHICYYEQSRFGYGAPVAGPVLRQEIFTYSP